MSSMILLMLKFYSPSLSHLKIHFCSRGKSQIEHNGSMQHSRPEHKLDGGDAAHWWSIPSDDRISLVSHVVDNIPLTPVMVSHISSA